MVGKSFLVGGNSSENPDKYLPLYLQFNKVLCGEDLSAQLRWKDGYEVQNIDVDLHLKHYFYLHICLSIHLWFHHFVCVQKTWTWRHSWNWKSFAASVLYLKYYPLHSSCEMKKSGDQFPRKVTTCFRHYKPKLILPLKSVLLYILLSS